MMQRVQVPHSEFNGLTKHFLEHVDVCDVVACDVSVNVGGLSEVKASKARRRFW